MQKKHQITIRDLARMSGFSVATVSRSLNNSPLVKEETRKTILSLADDVGFECNAIARGLATSKVGTIGIILPAEYDRFEQHLYYSSLMNDLRESLEKADYDLIVSFTENRFTGRSHILRLINRQKVDGLIILREELDQKILDFLERRNIPFIFSHYPPRTANYTFDVVYPDHFWGGKLAGEHVASLGCRSVVCLCAESKASEFTSRVDGFLEAFYRNRDARVHYETLYCPLTIEDGYRIVQEHAEMFHSTQALFTVTDLLAFGAMQAARDLGLRIPEDLALVGYDDTPLAAALKPALSSVHQPREIIARETCRRLLEKIENTDTSAMRICKIIRPHLVVRASSDVRRS